MVEHYDTLATLRHFNMATHITDYNGQKRLGDTTPPKVLVWGACEIRQRQLIYCRSAIILSDKDFFENGQRDFGWSLFRFSRAIVIYQREPMHSHRPPYLIVQGLYQRARVKIAWTLTASVAKAQQRSCYNSKFTTQSLVARRFTIMGFQVEKSPARMCLRASPTSQR